MGRTIVRKKRDPTEWKREHGRRTIPEEHRMTILTLVTIWLREVSATTKQYRAKIGKPGGDVHLGTYKYWSNVESWLTRISKMGYRSVSETQYNCIRLALVSDQPASILSLSQE